MLGGELTRGQKGPHKDERGEWGTWEREGEKSQDGQHVGAFVGLNIYNRSMVRRLYS